MRRSTAQTRPTSSKQLGPPRSALRPPGARRRGETEVTVFELVPHPWCDLRLGDVVMISPEGALEPRPARGEPRAEHDGERAEHVLSDVMPGCVGQSNGGAEIYD